MIGTLIHIVIKSAMSGNLLWIFVFTGIGIGITIELLGLPVLPIGILLKHKEFTYPKL